MNKIAGIDMSSIVLLYLGTFIEVQEIDNWIYSDEVEFSALSVRERSFQKVSTKKLYYCSSSVVLDQSCEHTQFILDNYR